MKFTDIKSKEEVVRTTILSYHTDVGVILSKTFEEVVSKSGVKYSQKAIQFLLDADFKIKGIDTSYLRVLYIPDFDLQTLQQKVIKDGFSALYKCNSYVYDENDVDLNAIYIVHEDTKMVFDNELKPISMPFTFDYIGSIVEEFAYDHVYRELYEAFSKHPYVIELTEYEIPYYNSDFNNQMGIELAVVLIPSNIAKQYIEQHGSRGFKDAVLLRMPSNLYGKEIAKLYKKYRNRKID